MATIDIELQNIDINQCNLDDQQSDSGLDIFRGTHRCRPTTKVFHCIYCSNKGLEIDITISTQTSIWNERAKQDIKTLSTPRMKRNMSRLMGKPTTCICENKDADQLRGNREADQRLCFRYTDSTIPLLPEYEISCFLLSFVAVHAGLCHTWSETTLLVFP